MPTLPIAIAIYGDNPYLKDYGNSWKAQYFEPETWESSTIEKNPSYSSKLSWLPSSVSIKVNKNDLPCADHIKEAIEESKYILTLEDNWDGEGAIKPPAFLYERAIDFVKKYSNYVKLNYGLSVVSPDISPLKDGSIDLNWKADNGSLLLNIKNCKESIGYYYGEVYDEEKQIFDVNGKISLNAIVDTFASWFIHLSKMENKEN